MKPVYAELVMGDFTRGDMLTLARLVRRDIRKRRNGKERRPAFVPEPGKIDIDKVQIERLERLMVKLVTVIGPDHPVDVGG